MSNGFWRMVALAIISLCVVRVAIAANPSISIDAQQRYPWNGLVDVTCQVSGIDGSVGYEFGLAAVLPDIGSTNKLFQYSVMGNESKETGFKVMTNGTYRLLWNAGAELGESGCSNVAIKVDLDEYHDRVQLWENGPYWATMNIGAKKTTDLGYGFSWGGVIGYTNSYSSEWILCPESVSNLSFVAVDPSIQNKSASELENEGVITKDGILTPKYDAARVHWGDKWRMPTSQELYDLCHKCDWIGVVDYVGGELIRGCIVRGKGVYASKKIFLPDQIYRYNYWSAEMYLGADSVYSIFVDGNSYPGYGSFPFLCRESLLNSTRYFIRPVIDTPDEVALIKMDPNEGEGSAQFSRRKGSSLGELPAPKRKGYMFAGWWTEPNGGTRVTATTIVSDDATYYAHWEVFSSDDKVQLWEGGPYWATTNIGAREPWESGYYFWWGDTVGYKRENNVWVSSDGFVTNFSFVEANTPTIDMHWGPLRHNNWITILLDSPIIQSMGNLSLPGNGNTLMPSRDAAYKHLGSDWRMPTWSELEGLQNNCDCILTNMYGVEGRVYRGRGEYVSRSIFLPASGFGQGESLVYGGIYYWSSTAAFDGDGDDAHGYGRRDRYIGKQIRPVSDGAYLPCIIELNANNPNNANDPHGVGSGGGMRLLRTKGSTLEILPSAICTGMAFDGWWTEPIGGTQVTASTVVTGDATYYAHWKDTEYEY